MIYRILIDFRYDFKMLTFSYRLKEGAARDLAKYLPNKFGTRVGALEGQIFERRALLVEALRAMVGPRRYSLIEAHVRDLITCSEAVGQVNATEEWKEQEDRVRSGPGYGILADTMDEYGLDAPAIQNTRARFYFTEKGWQAVGRHVAAEARRMGHTLQVLKQKNPDRSRIVYADHLQVAVLPDKNCKGHRSN
jgi:hypothetical protein